MHEKFIQAIHELPEWGNWVKATRTGDTAIGKTFEDLMGIVENNSPEADFHGVEIKTKRATSDSLLTLFTARPCWPLKASRGIVERFGYIREDEPDEPCVKRFYQTLYSNKNNGSNLNIIPSNDGVNLECDGEPIAIWNTERLYKISNRKLSALGFVLADTRKIHGYEEFLFREATLLWNFSYDKFIQAIIDGKVSIDFRVKIHENRLRDHGTAFRIMKEHLSLLYENVLQL
jgi:hypothetical protein